MSASSDWHVSYMQHLMERLKADSDAHERGSSTFAQKEARARDSYFSGEIDAAEFERRIERAVFLHDPSVEGL